MSDYPRMRQMKICPICLNDKDQGLLLCWTCHHEEKAENNGAYSAKTEKMLARREEYLHAFDDFERLAVELVTKAGTYITKH